MINKQYNEIITFFYYSIYFIDYQNNVIIISLLQSLSQTFPSTFTSSALMLFKHTTCEGMTANSNSLASQFFQQFVTHYCPCLPRHLK